MNRPQTSIAVCLVSLGCPKNLVDSEKILAHLAEGGCIVGAPMGQADTIVINTCGFLSSAREESMGVIREALAHKQAGRARRVVVAGCLVNRDAEKLFDLADGIDAIVGVNDRDTILSAVTGRRRARRISDVPVAKGGAVTRPAIASDAGRFRLTARHTAYLRIAEGCSQRCTFCTIPALRGPFRSKAPADVLAEANELARDGAVELNLIGQDTTTYGRDLDESLSKKPSLASLLRQLDRVPGVEWIRLMYAYPRHFTEDLIEAIAQLPHVVKYVDLPLQHMADGVLRRMGRAVGRAAIEKLLCRLRERIPHVAIRTTFIVGFPGETEDEFRQLLDFVRGFRFDALGVFEYSPEEGTPAARLKGPVEPAVKAQRAREIMLAQQKIAFAANRRKVGRKLRVLVDGVDGAGRCVGRHEGQAPEIDSVCILDRSVPAGRMVEAKVVGTENYDLQVAVGDWRSGICD